MKKIPLLLLLTVVYMMSFAQVVKPKPSTVKLFFEKAFLHTDRDIYTPGDTLWFKAYLTNAQDKSLKELSRNLYVDLIDPNGHLLNSINIEIQNNQGHGDFTLPDSIPAGYYRIRAYTTWMRNFGNYFVFEKKIALLQPAKAGPATLKGKSLPGIAKEPSVRFFPESGSMIEGVAGIVAVKAEDANGKGLKASGVVLSSAGDTVTHFTCDSLGMGLMVLLPEAGHNYTASVKIGSRTFHYPVPAALKYGFALHVKQADTLVQAVISYRSPEAATPPKVNVFVKSAGRTIISKSVQVNNAQEELAIPNSLLPEGICSIILADQDGKPNCERLFFVHHPANEKDLQLTTGKLPSATTLNIQTTPGARLSMAIIQDGLLLKDSHTIASQIFLASELRGAIEQPARYFDPKNTNRFKELDNLMLTQGWRDYTWRRLADSALRISYGIEKGINVTGTVKNEARNKPIPNAHITLFAGQLKNAKLFMTQTDSAGRFMVEELPVIGNQAASLSSVNDKGKKVGRIYMDTLVPMPISTAPGLKETDTLSIPRYFTTRSNHFDRVTQLKEVKVSGKSKVIHLPNGRGYTPWGDSKIFNITPKDYEYKTLEWYLIQFTQAHEPKDIRQPGVAYFSDGRLVPPIITINDPDAPNGIRIPRKEERDLIYSLPLDKIKKIQVTPVAEIGGGIRRIVSLTIIDNGLEDNPGILSTNISGYYQAQTFYQPLSDDGAIQYTSHPTVAWQPDVRLDATGHAAIRVSNKPSTSYQVVVQGLSADGSPLSQVIHVKN
ncbi:MG2 domain-containing protein [Mucilaginibacter yixingensis]|uniref:MG2 domain-containing protein n=1 Tax=Mucilaginibacter yixingensis TaxID=1295612 RepID=A0A2T5JBK4_9SPHI|nr:MG2 domain-containing protein [Mucilaginibacter yixingensis]PTQ98245.1 MG2 domain-containing protein [Mucilaginibacter yixingensis]